MKRTMNTIVNANRQRGSVLVMVVVLIIMMVLIGTAYMQVARVQRQGIQQPGGDIQAVKFSIIAQIQSVLLEDLIDKDGDFFNPTSDLNSENVETGFDEPYDYAHTNRDRNDPKNQYPAVSPINGNRGNAIGGLGDDKWLAEVVPYNVGGTGAATWRHLSNMTGLRLTNQSSTADLSELDPGELPEEHVIDHLIAPFKQDTDILVSQTFLVDGDGDGVGDSGWEWAPIVQINGIMYTMAVRITDLGARLNLSTATRLTGNGTSVGLTPDQHPHGLFPTDIDLSRLLSRARVASGGLVTTADWQNELNRAMAKRQLATGGGASLFRMGDPQMHPASAGGGGRVDGWLDRVRMYGAAVGQPFTIQDELELRHRNGLNSLFEAPIEAQTPTPMMTKLLRSDAGEELVYDGLAAVSGGNVDAWMKGGVDNTTISARSFPDVRKMLTTASGASVFAANHGLADGGGNVIEGLLGKARYGRPLRYDLKFGNPRSNWTGTAFPGYDIETNATHQGNFRVYRGGENRINKLHEIISRVFKLDPGNNADNYLSKTDQEIDNLVWKYAAMIHDYSDADSVPTQVNVGGVAHYGMERLPFIREVYAQARYLNTIDYWDAGAGMAGMDGNGDLWMIQRGSECLAVEIANPFDHPITIDSRASANPNSARVELAVRYTDTGGTEQEVIFEIPDGTTIDPGEYLVIYSNPKNDSNDEGGKGNALDTDLMVTPAVAPAQRIEVTDANPGGGVLTFAAGDEQAAIDLIVDATINPTPPAPSSIDGQTDLDTPVIVELRVVVDAGDAVAYDRMEIPGSDLGMSGHFSSNTDPPSVYRHAQSTTRRDGRNSRYITNDKNESKLREPGQGGSYQDQDYDWLGSPSGASPAASKDVADDAAKDARLDAFQLAVANRPIFSVTELGIVPMFAFSETHTFVDFYDGTNGVAEVPEAERFLAIVAPPPQKATLAMVPESTGITHAAMLMDQFTTLHPGKDGVDNDNADDDNNDATGVDDVLTIANMTGPQFEEVFVPGLMNINTTPLHLLVLASAIPDNMNNTEQLMRAIVRYRDDLSGTGSDRKLVVSNDLPNVEKDKLRTKPGIQSIGELLLIDENNPGNPAANMRHFGSDGTAQVAPATGVDLFPLPAATALGATPREHKDSQEEALARFQFLANNFTTRSDRYVAEVLIRGWNAVDFSNNGDGAIEELRFIAVFDRSGVVDVDSKVEVLGIRDLE